VDQVAQPVTSEDTDLQSAPVEGELHPTIASYFETLHRGDFAATAALFAPEGTLYPPLEASVTGTEAIATYLAAEVPGIKLFPRNSVIVSTAPTENHSTQADAPSLIEYKVTGWVETRLFRVNVAWCFKLDAQSRLQSVGIKLLATLAEVLHLRPENRNNLEPDCPTEMGESQ